jgi:sRNA-binding regulator protein Hfq
MSELQQHGTTVTPISPAARSPEPGPFVAVQNRWLKGMRGKAIRIQLGSGQVIAGVLEGDDSYTLALRIPGHPETALVYKHSIEYLVPTTSR